MVVVSTAFFTQITLRIVHKILHMQVLYLHTITMSLGPEEKKINLMFHAIIWCDHVTKHPFPEQRKITTWVMNKVFAVVLVGLDAHGQVTEFPPSKKAVTSYFQTSELFDALVYDRTSCCESLDEACKYSLKLGSQLNSSHQPHLFILKSWTDGEIVIKNSVHTPTFVPACTLSVKI